MPKTLECSLEDLDVTGSKRLAGEVKVFGILSLLLQDAMMSHSQSPDLTQVVHVVHIAHSLLAIFGEDVHSPAQVFCDRLCVMTQICWKSLMPGMAIIFHLLSS